MPRRFALDHNFPQPIVTALSQAQANAELVRMDRNRRAYARPR